MASEVKTKELTGAQIFMKALKDEGVDKIWGYPGAILLSIYEELYHASDIKHYLVRHEQFAVHAAEGYARVSGKCGVALVTSGPGATNTLTGIANAYLDGYPLVVFTGQVPFDIIGKDAFQEVNIVDMARPCTKMSVQVKNVNDLEKTIKEAFYIAKNGRPGPVLIDLPKNILEAKCSVESFSSINVKKIHYEIDDNKISKAINLLCNAKRPMIISGGGVVISDASKQLTELAKKINSPVSTTLMGLGTYECDDETNLGMLGVLGNYWANQAVSECDVLLAVGTRLNDRILAPVKNCAKNAQIIHIDIDPVNISKMLKAQIEIIGDAKEILNLMLSKFQQNFAPEEKKQWIEEILQWKSNKVMPAVKSEKLHACTVLEMIYEYTKKYDPIVATEVGQHQMWAAQCFKFTKPRKFLTSGGLGTMGFGLPAAMGACLADKNALVLNIAGDGSAQMNIQELATCVEYNLPVKVMILNNGYLGMVRQWQEKFCDKHYSGTQISSPDFVKVAQAYGAMGIRVEREEEIVPALKKAIEYPGPVFLDFIIEPYDVVYPWIKG